MPYAGQLERKREALERLFRTAAGPGLPPVPMPTPMPVSDDGMPWGFRHKAAFVFGAGTDRGLVMGHFAAGTQDVVPVTECPVHAERANRIAFTLRDELARARVPAAGPSLDGVLRHLIVRTSADQRDAVALLVVTRNVPSLRKPVRALLASEHRPGGLFLNIHPKPSPYMVGSETMRLDGHAHVRERRLGPTFLVSPTAFFQTNPDAAAALVATVLDEMPGERLRVLDLYAGSGLFSVPLAARGHRVMAVEENPRAVTDASKNVDVNRIDQRLLRLVCARVEDALPSMARDPVDVVVLDPPRHGCPPAVLAGVFSRLAPRRAVYVSCNPEALASELPEILRAGYRVTRIQPVDMFPHTPHVETVMTFARADEAGPGRAP